MNRMQKLLIVLVHWLLLSAVWTSSGFAEFLPKDDAFLPLVADVREAQFSIRREYHNTSQGGFDAGAVSFGDFLPIVNFWKDGLSFWQFGIDGSLYALYNLDKPSFDLINTDYLFGLNISFTDGNPPEQGSFSVRNRLYHQSSHLGDEFILENPEFDRDNSSFEDLEIVAAYTYTNWRAYLGGGVIFRSNSIEELDPLHARWGLEFRSNNEPLLGYWLVAADYEIQQRTEWSIGQSYLAGRGFRGESSREIRLMFSYFKGNSPQGQFYRERLEYVGFGIYFLV